MGFDRIKAFPAGGTASQPARGGKVHNLFVEVIDSDLSGRGATRAEVVQGAPTQSHISPSLLVNEDNDMYASLRILVYEYKRG